MTAAGWLMLAPRRGSARQRPVIGGSPHPRWHHVCRLAGQPLSCCFRPAAVRATARGDLDRLARRGPLPSGALGGAELAEAGDRDCRGRRRACQRSCRRQRRRRSWPAQRKGRLCGDLLRELGLGHAVLLHGDRHVRARQPEHRTPRVARLPVVCRARMSEAGSMSASTWRLSATRAADRGRVASLSTGRGGRPDSSEMPLLTRRGPRRAGPMRENAAYVNPPLP